MKSLKQDLNSAESRAAPGKNGDWGKKQNVGRRENGAMKRRRERKKRRLGKIRPPPNGKLRAACLKDRRQTFGERRAGFAPIETVLPGRRAALSGKSQVERTTTGKPLQMRIVSGLTRAEVVYGCVCTKSGLAPQAGKIQRKQAQTVVCGYNAHFFLTHWPVQPHDRRYSSFLSDRTASVRLRL